MDCSQAGSSVHGIIQARILECFGRPSSRESSICLWHCEAGYLHHLESPINYYCCSATKSCLTLCNPWTIACKAALSMGLSRQEYWSGFPCPPPGDLSNPGMEPVSLVSFALQADSLSTAPPEESMLLLLLLQMIKRQYGLLWLKVKGYLSRFCHQTMSKMREAAEIQKVNSTGKVPRH